MFQIYGFHDRRLCAADFHFHSDAPVKTCFLDRRGQAATAPVIAALHGRPQEDPVVADSRQLPWTNRTTDQIIQPQHCGKADVKHRRAVCPNVCAGQGAVLQKQLTRLHLTDSHRNRADSKIPRVRLRLHPSPLAVLSVAIDERYRQHPGQIAKISGRANLQGPIHYAVPGAAM